MPLRALDGTGLKEVIKDVLGSDTCDTLPQLLEELLQILFAKNQLTQRDAEVILKRSLDVIPRERV